MYRGGVGPGTCPRAGRTTGPCDCYWVIPAAGLEPVRSALGLAPACTGGLPPTSLERREERRGLSERCQSGRERRAARSLEGFGGLWTLNPSRVGWGFLPGFLLAGGREPLGCGRLCGRRWPRRLTTYRRVKLRLPRRARRRPASKRYGPNVTFGVCLKSGSGRSGTDRTTSLMVAGGNPFESSFLFALPWLFVLTRIEVAPPQPFFQMLTLYVVFGSASLSWSGTRTQCRRRPG